MTKSWLLYFWRRDLVCRFGQAVSRFTWLVLALEASSCTNVGSLEDHTPGRVSVLDSGEPVPDSGEVNPGLRVDPRLASAEWFDGGLGVRVQDLWRSALLAQSTCFVFESGNLLFNTPTRDRVLQHIILSQSGQRNVGPPDSDLRVTGLDESLSWCKADSTGRNVCMKEFSDGGLIRGPDELVYLYSWTGSGFISGAIRTDENAFESVVYYPDGGRLVAPAMVLTEDAVGVGQGRDANGVRVAVIWRDGQSYRLENSPSDSSWGAAVNASGLVVGQRFVGNLNSAAVFAAGEARVLPKRYGHSAELFAVNGAGLAVGQERAARRAWAVVWYRGATVYLDEVADAGAGCWFSNSTSVNGRNEVAATVTCADDTTRCVRVRLGLITME